METARFSSYLEPKPARPLGFPLTPPAASTARARRRAMTLVASRTPPHTEPRCCGRWAARPSRRPGAASGCGASGSGAGSGASGCPATATCGGSGGATACPCPCLASEVGGHQRRALALGHEGAVLHLPELHGKQPGRMARLIGFEDFGSESQSLDEYKAQKAWKAKRKKKKAALQPSRGSG